MVRRTREVIAPPHLVLMKAHLKHCIQVCALHCQKDTELLECVQRGATKLGETRLNRSG